MCSLPSLPLRRRSAATLVLAAALSAWAAREVAGQAPGARTGTIQGVVTRAETRTPLSDVFVTVRRTGATVLTDTAGRYVLPAVPEGPQTILFRRIGQLPSERGVDVVAGGAQTLDVELESPAVMLGTVVVRAVSRAPERIVEAPAAVAVVDAHTLTAISSTGQAPLALAAVPGVDIVQSGVNDFNVNARGFNSSLNRRMLVLQDGRDLSIALLGSQEWYAMALPTEDFERVEVVRGPGSALYGANAFNGVVNITTPTAREVRGTKVSLSGGELSSFRGDVRHADLFGSDRFGYRVNVGYNRSESWSRPRTRFDSLDLRREYAPATDSTVPKNIERRPLNGQTLDPTTGAALGEPDALENLYGSARLDFYALDGSVGTLEGGAARVQNEILTTGVGRVQVTDALRPWARAAWAMPRLNLMAWYSGRSSREPQYTLAAGAPLDEQSTILHAEGQFNHSFAGERARLVTGASIRNTRIDTDGTLITPVEDDRSDDTYSAFGQLEYTITPRLRGVAAARYDHGDLYSGQFSPKAAIVFSPSERHSLRLTFNRAFQTPNYSEFFLRAPAGAPLAGPAQLEAGLEQYFVNARNALGEDADALGIPAELPYDFSAQTAVLALGNRQLNVERVLGYELGYKGALSARAFVTVDLYLDDVRDFVTDLLPAVNPAYPRYLLTDGGTDVLRNLADLDSAFAARGLAADHPLRAARPVLRAGFNQLSAGAGPLLATLPTGERALVVSYTNAGRVQTRGAELGASFHWTDALRFDASYAFFDFDVKEQQLGDALLPNTPEHKGHVGLVYTRPRGIDLGARVRLASGFRWAAGVFQGYVPASQLVDLSAAYRFTPTLRVHAIATNLLDQERFQLFGGSVIRRRVLAGVTANF